MESLFQDIRYGLRQVRRAPGFGLVAVLSLAVGIGATTAVFSIVYASLLHPYPFRDWERLVTLSVADRSGNTRFIPVNGGQLQQLQKAEVVEQAVAFDSENLSTTGGIGSGDLPEDVNAVLWTTNALGYFGVAPEMGRDFVADDAPEGQEPQAVVLLGYAFWQRHFGGDKGVLGQTIELAHTKYKIVGVMSPYMTWNGGDVYLPLKLTRDPTVRLALSIRLKPGVTPEAASQALQPLLDEFAKETPVNFPNGFKAKILPLSNGIKVGLGPSLRLLFGAVCLLLFVACLNVSILLLARGTRRQYELAVRSAMGAPRKRIVRQLLTEALVIALIGEMLGVVLAFALQKLVVAQLPFYLAARAAMIHINVPVLLFSVTLTLASVLGFGLLPAIQLSRRELRNTMQLGSQKLAGTWGRHTRNALIATQVALSLVLLASAATSVRAFLSLMKAQLGYDPQNAMMIATPIHPNSYTRWQERAAFLDRLQQKLASTPGVTDVSVAMGARPPVNGLPMWFEILGEAPVGDQQVRAAFVGPEYFETLRVPLLRGRTFDRTEVARGAGVALINETMARRYFPNGDAVGRQIKLPKLVAAAPNIVAAPGSTDWVQIIGVASDALNNGLRDPVQPAVYLPYTFRMSMFPGFMVRTQGNPLAMLRSLRTQVQSVAADQQVGRNATSLEDDLTQQDDWQRGHMVAMLFSGFSIITLLLAGVGLYSVVAYTVAQRTSEFALRMALGAQRADVLRNVCLSIGGVVLVGVGAGVLIQLAVSKIVAQWAYASGRDPVTIALVVPLLAVVAAAACYVPARRAMRLDPMQALRHE